MESKDFVITQGRAVHMVGEYVAVCCNTHRELKTVTHEGREYDTYISVPDYSKPYIDFVYLRQDRGGDRP